MYIKKEINKERKGQKANCDVSLLTYQITNHKKLIVMYYFLNNLSIAMAISAKSPITIIVRINVGIALTISIIKAIISITSTIRLIPPII